jgi:hypothetical protein
VPRKWDVTTCRGCGMVLTQWTADVAHGERGWTDKLRCVELLTLPALGTPIENVRCPRCDTRWNPDPTYLPPE